MNCRQNQSLFCFFTKSVENILSKQGIAIKAVLTATALLTSCLEMTKLIPAAEPEEIPGFSPASFSSGLNPLSLAPNPSYGLDTMISGSITANANLGEAALSEKLRLFETDLAELQSHLGDASLGSFLRNLPPQPDSKSIQSEVEKLKKSTARTNFVAALASIDSGETFPLIETQTSSRFDATQSRSQFKLFLPPGSVFTGLGKDFNPTSRTAAEAGVVAAQPNLAQNWSLVSFESAYAYARSLQPSNQYQVVVECSRILLNTAEAAGLELIWPRALIYESLQDPSQHQSVFRLHAVVTESSEAGFQLESSPISIETRTTRSDSYLSLRYQFHTFDGAQSGRSYSLFHEADQLFLTRFSTSQRSTFTIDHIWTSFQLPNSKLVISAQERRSEFGLSQRAFSDEQVAFFTGPEGPDGVTGFDGVTSPPEDKWLRLDPVRLYNAKQERVAPAQAPEFQAAGLHHVDPESFVSQAGFSLFFRGVESRPTASDVSLLEPEQWQEMQSFCSARFTDSAP